MRKGSENRPAASRETRSRTKPDHLSVEDRPRKTEFWELRLYVAGQTPRSLTAFANLKDICDEHLAGKYRIEVVDLVKNPQLAKCDQIVALPTLVRRLPEPVRKVIGHLSDTEKVLVGLQLRPRARDQD